MGSTSSKGGDGEESDRGFFSAFLLCGGGDAVDEKAVERYVAKQNMKNASQGGVLVARSAELRPKPGDAMRVQQSAHLFLREFKSMLRKQGFSAYKYTRSGRSASRIFHLDPDETMLMWETKKTARIANGDRFDHLLLGDIAKVDRCCPNHTFDDDRFFVTIETPKRHLVLGFDVEKRSLMFADGLSLLIADFAEK